MKIGSLFDGSGGFPLAGALCDLTPVWASEIEPYPIAVTKSRFPKMKHLGDISKINGAEIEPVDIITFGSPCQDMSVAGKRAGLKHEDNGDDETTRSGLFMEAVRIIKEMRCATNGKYPRFAVWENVPGAFSSNKGEDFRLVLEELIKIAEPDAVMPEVPKKGWAYADYYCGDGWSIAYRIFDAQYIRTAQRRRRIYLVLDLGGQCAGKILFERQSLRGYFTESGTQGKTTPADVERSVGTDDREGAIGFDRYNQCTTGEVSETLKCPNGGDNYPTVCYGIGVDIYNTTITGDKVCSFWKHAEVANMLNTFDQGEARANEIIVMATQQGGAEIAENLCPTITAAAGMSGNNQPVICLQGNGIDRADTAVCNGKGWKEDASYTLNTIDRPAVVYAIDQQGGKGGANYAEEVMPTLCSDSHGTPHGVAYEEPITLHGNNVSGTLMARNYKGIGRWDSLGSAVCVPTPTKYIVRRLTPTECARLQGFPDTWGHIDHKDDFTDEEYEFWLNVRNTHAEINGKQVKYYTKKQMLTWYNKLHTDSAEYKLWGNGIALPCALYVMQGIEDVLKGEK